MLRRPWVAGETCAKYIAFLKSGHYSYEWYRDNSTKPRCQTDKDFDRFLEVTGEIGKMGEKQLGAATGCLASCRKESPCELKFKPSNYYKSWFRNRRTEYEAQGLLSLTSEHPLYPKDIFMIQISYSGSNYVEKEEYLVYGATNLIADVGGYLGLLMGHSILSLYDLAKGALNSGGSFLGFYKDNK